jgi:hypothetical protein
MASYERDVDVAPGTSIVDLKESEFTPSIQTQGEGEGNHDTSFEAQVDAAMQSFEPAAERAVSSVETQHAASSPELPVQATEAPLQDSYTATFDSAAETQHAASLPEIVAEPALVPGSAESATVDAISSLELPAAEIEPATSVVHGAAPETDDTVIERMRESLSNLPVENASMPELGSETDALPRAMAAAAAAAAPSFAAESAAHDAAFEITRALSYAVGAETASEATAASPSQTDDNKPSDANKMASAVERVLQRELPSLVWKVMAEIDIEKQRR